MKLDLKLLPDPAIFLSSKPTVTPTPRSELKVPASSKFPVFVSSSISILISANWLLVSICVLTS